MKTYLQLWSFPACRAAVFAGSVCLAIAGAAADASDPFDSRSASQAESLQIADALERKARQLEADEHPERARDLMRQAEELRTQAARPAGNREPNPESERERDIARQLREAKAQRQRMQAAGNNEQALVMQQRIDELQQQSARVRGRPTARGGIPRALPPGGALARLGPEPAGPEPRLRHLEAAIDNLHAAGMHELAERLSQQAQSMRENMRARDGARDLSRATGAELQDLRAEVQQIRRTVRELQNRLEELSVNSGASRR